MRVACDLTKQHPGRCTGCYLMRSQATGSCLPGFSNGNAQCRDALWTQAYTGSPISSNSNRYTTSLGVPHCLVEIGPVPISPVLTESNPVPTVPLDLSWPVVRPGRLGLLGLCKLLRAALSSAALSAALSSGNYRIQLSQDGPQTLHV